MAARQEKGLFQPPSSQRRPRQCRAPGTHQGGQRRLELGRCFSVFATSQIGQVHRRRRSPLLPSSHLCSCGPRRAHGLRASCPAEPTRDLSVPCWTEPNRSRQRCCCGPAESHGARPLHTHTLSSRVHALVADAVPTMLAPFPNYRPRGGWRRRPTSWRRHPCSRGGRPARTASAWPTPPRAPAPGAPAPKPPEPRRHRRSGRRSPTPRGRRPARVAPRTYVSGSTPG